MRKDRESVLERLGRAQALIDQGSGIKSACKKAGVGDVTYYTYRKKGLIGEGKRTPKQRLVILPEAQPSGKVMVLMGSPSDVVEAARGFFQ